jgi:hypothetical protein
VQRARYVRAAIATPAWRGALLIRDRNKLEFVRSRFCSASFRFAPCCAALGTRIGEVAVAIKTHGNFNWESPLWLQSKAVQHYDL